MIKVPRFLIMLFLVLSLAFGLTCMGGAQGASDTATGGARALSQSWFGDKPILSGSSTGYEHALYIYFKYRESDFGTDSGLRSGSSALKSDEVATLEKARTAAVGEMEKRGLRLLDAAVTVSVRESAEAGDLVRVTADEWTFYDYDDLHDGVFKPDVSGFGTTHRLLLARDGADYRILGDAYDESDIDGINTAASAVTGQQQPVLANATDKATPAGFYSGYDPGKAVSYADAHVFKGADMGVSGVFEQYYNPEYFNFNAVGGDCANYVSQCLYAGGMPQTLGDSKNGWYFSTENDRSDTWTRSTLLRRWLGSTCGVTVDNPRDADILTGSPVFYSRSKGYTWDHSTICVGVNSAGTPVVNSHNNDRYHVVWNYWPSGTTISTVQLTAKAAEAVKTDKLSLSTYGYPTTIVTGGSFPVYGTVTSERSPISSVTVGVYDQGSNQVIGGTFQANERTAALDTLDDDIHFGALSAGWYHYKVTAVNQSGPATLVDKLFLVNDGSGSESDPYRVDSASMLAGLAEASDNGWGFRGASFRLTADISLAGTAWKPIGTDKTPFSGTFDGYAHTITGLGKDGLFCLGKDGTVMNLASDGVIAGTGSGTLVNCLLTAGSPAAGSSVSLVNCWYPAAGGGTVEQLNSFVKDTDKNGTGRYFLWKAGTQHPEFAPLTVTFYTSADARVPSATVAGLPYGAKITVPALTLPDGQVVSKWTTGTGGTQAWDTGTPVTADLSLVAVLKKESYTITLDSKGGSQVTSPGLRNYGDPISLPVPSRDGYTFTGWFAGEKKADWTAVPDLGADGRTVTLTAGWTGNSCTLALNAPGAGNAYAVSAAATVGAARVDITVLPQKADAGFAGFYTDDGRLLIDSFGKLLPNVDPYTDKDGNWSSSRQTVTLSARWNQGTCSLVYETNYGSLSDVQALTKNHVYMQSCQIGAKVTLPIPKRTGYIFKGWHENNDFSGPEIWTLPIGANTVLYAEWTPANQTWDNPFTDVRPGDWFENAVRYACQNDVMKGTAADTFAPSAGVTRAMLVTMLWRMEGAPMPAGPGTYNDVPAGAWYTDAVSWGTEKGIVTGIGDSRFAPADMLTRQDCVTILYRYARSIGMDASAGSAAALSTFKDAGSVSDYAVGALRWAVEKGLVTGTSTVTLSPKQGLTRASAAALLMRLGQN